MRYHNNLFPHLKLMFAIELEKLGLGKKKCNPYKSGETAYLNIYNKKRWKLAR